MTTLERARRLAGEQPEGPVPCPVCAAEVKGGNLDRHLAKVHEGDGGAHESRWSGPERIGSRRLLGLALVVVVATAAYVAVTGDQDDRVIFGAGVLLAVSMVVWGAVAWGAPLFPGRLRVDSRGALLRHSYGLGRRRLRSVDVVVLGSAWESRPSGSGSDGTYASVDVKAGTYLQLCSGRRRITVHCRAGGAVRSTWRGWEQGRKRKGLGITLDRSEFVALQLALWELGMLTPRPPSSPRQEA